jgi:hypothetical protein
MNFKQFYKEGLVRTPTDDIRKWVESHYEEFITKLKETLTKGYNTDINDYFVFSNPYTKENMEIGIEIQKKVMNSGDTETALYYDPKNRMITISAEEFYKEFKSNLKEGLIGSIIHEVTHSIDPGFTKKPMVVGDFEDYANSEREIVAFNREYIDRIKHLTKPKQLVILDKIRKGMLPGIKDIDDYVSSLNLRNKKKFINQLVKEIL